VLIDAGAVTLACDVHGPDDGELVLCVHGFPDCARSFRHQIEPLVARGYRVATPTLRGYAPSSLARDKRYDVEALAADLCAIAMRLSSRPVRLVGHDWGAIASYAAVAYAPHLFSHLCTIAVPHLRVAGPRFASAAQLKRSWYIGFFQLRMLAERRVAQSNMAFIDRLWRDWSPGYLVPDEELEAIKAALAPPDHLRAALSYYRAMMSFGALTGESRKLLLRRTELPSIYVHGEDDGCIGVELAQGLESAYGPRFQAHLLPRAGHFAHLEQPQVFNAILLDFLASPAS
jgi:pimeloyl-ACP methyl ester carboxylesterase